MRPPGESSVLVLTVSLVLGSILACAVGESTDSTDTTPPADTEGTVDGDLDGDGYVSDDCEPEDGSVHPDATETCNDVDDDCDGETDEDLGATWCADADGDGFGDATASERRCEQQAGYVSNCDDCDDEDFMVYPGAAEECGDREDDDCDGSIDNGC